MPPKKKLSTPNTNNNQTLEEDLDEKEAEKSKLVNFVLEIDTKL